MPMGTPDIYIYKSKVRYHYYDNDDDVDDDDADGDSEEYGGCGDDDDGSVPHFVRVHLADRRCICTRYSFCFPSVSLRRSV